MNSKKNPDNGIDHSYPLTPMQQGMLFHSLYAPGSGVYIEQMKIDVDEELDVPSFLRAWHDLVRRHDVLRTGFRWEGLEKPVQDVYKEIIVPVEENDLRSLAAADRDAAVTAYLKKDAAEGFDLSRHPLMRLALFRMEDASWLCIWTFHHSILDGRSFTILLKELFELYEALRDRREPAAAVPRPFGDFARWISGVDFSGSEIYWRKTLEDIHSPTTVTAGEKPAGPGSGMIKREGILPAEATRRLYQFAGRHDLTANTVVQGAWALLLGRYSGEERVVFGATRACRRSSIEGADSTIGLFINTLPFVVPLPPDKEVIEWLKDLRTAWIELRDHELTPLLKIQEWSSLGSARSLFDTILVFENYQLSPFLKEQGGGWKNRSVSLLERANYPISVTAYGGDELLLKIEYDSTLFTGDSIERMMGHLITILDDISAGENRPLSKIRMLTAAERRTIIEEWNDTSTAFLDDTCLHEVFRQRADETPDAVAAYFRDEHLTYAQLESRSNGLARHLRRRGVGPDTPVGICIDRSLEMIVAIMAVLKAGGCYVPISTAYPGDRIAYMLEDARAPVLVTMESLLVIFPEGSCETICLDRDAEAISREGGDAMESGAGPGNLAYVIYTSGTTGKPRGVMIEHRSVLNLLKGLNDSVYSDTGERKLRVSVNGPISFDTSVKQIIQLLNGHTLDIIPEEIRFDGSALLSYLRERRIDVFDCTPSQLELLISAGILDDSAFTPGYVLIGGEPVDRALWKKLAGSSRIRFFDVYGPTECTVDATVCHIVEEIDTPVIGRPIANTRVYLLDRNLLPVPVGVPGEIHIGGAGVSRGYLGRVDKTAEKFIPDPFVSGGRLYRTGDLARLRPDGNIEFLRRIDNQVKIRGYRIELEEIELALGGHPGVAACVVAAREDRPGLKRLAAYIIPRAGYKIDPGEIRSFLKPKMPDYMIPAAYVEIDRFPLNPNGKVDRKSLPAPGIYLDASRDNIVPPRDDLEKMLVEIFEDLLGIKPIGIKDSFFDLGGHSLLAVRLFSEIAERLRRDLPLAMIFEAPTVEQLADVFRQDGWRLPGFSLVPINSSGSRPPFFCVHAYGGGVFFYRELVRHLPPDQPFYGLQSLGMNCRQLPHRSVEEMASHYIDEIKAVQPQSPYYIGGRCLGAYVALEIADQLVKRGEQVALLAILDSYWLPQEEKTVNQRIDYHRNMMKDLGPAGKLAYLARSGRNLLVKIGNRLKLAACKRYIKRGRMMPRFLRDYYINTYLFLTNLHAERKYKPPVYPGKITFFQASAEIERDPRSFWGKLTTQELDLYIVRATHKDILVEPNVGFLAEKLTEVLERTQEEYGSG